MLNYTLCLDDSTTDANVIRYNFAQRDTSLFTRACITLEIVTLVSLLFLRSKEKRDERSRVIRETEKDFRCLGWREEKQEENGSRSSALPFPRLCRATPGQNSSRINDEGTRGASMHRETCAEKVNGHDGDERSHFVIASLSAIASFNVQRARDTVVDFAPTTTTRNSSYVIFVPTGTPRQVEKRAESSVGDSGANSPASRTLNVRSCAI